MTIHVFRTTVQIPNILKEDPTYSDDMHFGIFLNLFGKAPFVDEMLVLNVTSPILHIIRKKEGDRSDTRRFFNSSEECSVFRDRFLQMFNDIWLKQYPESAGFSEETYTCTPDEYLEVIQDEANYVVRLF